MYIEFDYHSRVYSSDQLNLVPGYKPGMLDRVRRINLSRQNVHPTLTLYFEMNMAWPNTSEDEPPDSRTLLADYDEYVKDYLPDTQASLYDPYVHPIRIVLRDAALSRGHRPNTERAPCTISQPHALDQYDRTRPCICHIT